MTLAIQSPHSYLFVPGDRADRYDKACASAADAVIIDLEDAVATDNKLTARDTLADWLAGTGQAYVRVNGAETRWFQDDCRLLKSKGLLGAMLPKAEDPEAIRALVAQMPQGTPLLLLIETAEGLLRAADLASLPGVSRLVFGSVDFQLDCGIPDDDLGLAHARASLVLASAAARLAPPVDGVTTILDDPELLRLETDRARRLGFGGKLCIHPNQLATVNKGFAPTAHEVEHARDILAAVAASGNPGAALHKGKLVERPIITWAERIVARAES